jgi:Asp-tRNA(Asn)/Glu-tRNA(Gln) amidotransferase A subunit family amidase
MSPDPERDLPPRCASGLPLPVRFVGRAFDEAMVLRVSHAYERHAGWTE